MQILGKNILLVQILGKNILVVQILGKNILLVQILGKNKVLLSQPASYKEEGSIKQCLFCKSYGSLSWAGCFQRGQSTGPIFFVANHTDHSPGPAVYKEDGPVGQCCFANIRSQYSKHCPNSISIQQNSNSSKLQSTPAFGTIVREVIQGRAKICIFSVLQLSPKLIGFKYRNVTFFNDKHRNI